MHYTIVADGPQPCVAFEVMVASAAEALKRARQARELCPEVAVYDPSGSEVDEVELTDQAEREWLPNAA